MYKNYLIIALTLRPCHQGAAPARLHHPNNGIDVLQHYLHRVLLLRSAGNVDGPHLRNRANYYSSTSQKIIYNSQTLYKPESKWSVL